MFNKSFSALKGQSEKKGYTTKYSAIINAPNRTHALLIPNYIIEVQRAD